MSENLKEEFDKCIEQAISMGRKHMDYKSDEKTPFKQEFELALLLFEYQVLKK